MPSVAADRVVRPHNGQMLVLRTGNAVTLRLRACESCGYQWVVTGKPAASVVDYRGRSSTSTACPGCVGGNADESFDFVAVRLGQTQVRLSYVAPNRSVTKRVTVTLAVLRRPRSTAYSSVHVVRSGDTLYRIARRALGADGTLPRVRELAVRLYRDNRAVIGTDPGFLLPGEVLLVDLTALNPCGTTAKPGTCR